MSSTVLRTPAAAKYLGIAESTLTKTRLKGGPDAPPYIQLGSRSVGYLLSDLEAWVSARRHASASDRGTAVSE